MVVFSTAVETRIRPKLTIKNHSECDVEEKNVSSSRIDRAFGHSCFEIICSLHQRDNKAEQ